MILGSELTRFTFSPGSDSKSGQAFLEGFQKGQNFYQYDKQRLSILARDTRSDAIETIKIINELEQINQLVALIAPVNEMSSLSLLSSLSQSNLPILLTSKQNGEITEINEKPVHRFFVNAGLYVFDPKVLKLLSRVTNLDMPKFFEMIIEKNLKTMIFPILDEWIDIGNFDDYNRAKIKYSSKKF